MDRSARADDLLASLGRPYQELRERFGSRHAELLNTIEGSTRVRLVAEPCGEARWTVSIAAVDAKGRARYSPQWNKGMMSFALKPEDQHVWLVVAATPSAMPLSETNWNDGKISRPVMESNLMGVYTPRFPWEVTLTGCRPGSPHRRWPRR